MKIEIDLDQVLGLQYDKDGEPVGYHDLRQAVVEAAATDLLRHVRAALSQSVREQVASVVTEEVRDIVQAEMAKPIQQTSVWGEFQGEPTSVREVIRKKIDDYFKASGRSYNDTVRGSGGPQNLSELISENVRGVLSKELQEEIAKAKKKVNTEIRDHALKAAVEALAKGLNQ